MLRITLPALSNTFISLFKDTSVASVIAVPELTYGAQWINFNTFRIAEVYLVVTGDVSGHGLRASFSACACSSAASRWGADMLEQSSTRSRSSCRACWSRSRVGV